MAKTYVSLNPIIPWRQASGPIDWENIFDRKAPLELEIGFGNGERLVRRAQQRPDLNLLGIDISWPSTRRCLRKVGVLGLKNVYLVQAGVEMALQRLFLPQSIDKIVALFPRPWPARQHEKYRLFSKSCLDLMNNRLGLAKELEIVTDFEPFSNWVKSQAKDTDFALKYEEIAPGLETKYERKWLENGSKYFYRLVLTKTYHTIIKEIKDPTLKLHRLNDFDLRAFPLGDYNDRFFVSFKELIFDENRQKALLRTVAVEQELRQAFWLEFTKQEDKWQLRLAPGCGVMPVASVQWALDLAKDLCEKVG